jgi:hypothetical protein
MHLKFFGVEYEMNEFPPRCFEAEVRGGLLHVRPTERDPLIFCAEFVSGAEYYSTVSAFGVCVAKLEERMRAAHTKLAEVVGDGGGS